MSYYSFPKYVSVAEKRAKAEKKLKQLRKKNPDLQPVIIEGRSIATTWWGKEWNKNLERYADYSNRIGRGRSYVRHSAVLDLKISKGRVTALVQGSSSTPYSVSISIRPISRKNWAEIQSACKDKMDSLQKLISGKFPKALSEIFTQKGTGLFPTPEEISFDCSCPDWAVMCKHVAAVLYGVGARLDEDPQLFFVLRNVNSKDLVSAAVTESKNDLLKKAARKTSRVLSDGDGLSDMFGIDLGGGLDELPKPKIKRTGKVSEKSPGRKKQPVKKTVKVKPKTEKSSGTDELSHIETLIKKRSSGIRISILTEISGMDASSVRSAVARLKQQGRIESVSRGVYRVNRKLRK